MFAISERVRPWSARCSLRSVGRVTHELAVVLLDHDVAALALGQLAARAVDPNDLGLDLDLHALGDGDGLFADPAWHQTYATTSPPTPSLRAWWPVMTPFEVETITVPMPPSTFGHLARVRVGAAARARDALEAGDDASGGPRCT